MKYSFQNLVTRAAELAAGQTTPPAKSASDANNAFGFKLLAETCKQRPRENVFQSPLGLELALAMLENGAQGETLAQMNKALEQNGLSVEDLNKANRLLMTELAAGNPWVTLNIANALWTDEEASIKQTFLDLARDVFDAEAASVDFKDPAIVNRINDWASARTHGRISKILDSPLEPLMKMVVLNAIYFKGAWEEPFNSIRTSERPFHLADRSTANRPLMSKTGRFNYFENDQFQAVLLPYRGGQINMFVLLPKLGLDQFAADLTPDNWRGWNRQLRPQEGLVEFPSFTIEANYDLNNELKALGMARAFTAEAEFGGISGEPLFLSLVKQKTFLEVNEAGTEASAVSGGWVAAGIGLQIKNAFSLIVDHPFYLAIVDSRTDAILFHGMIFDPSPTSAAGGALS